MSNSLPEIVRLINRSQHSDDYKELITEYATALAVKDLPIIFDMFHLAQLIGMSPYRLFEIVRYRDLLYNTYKVRKKSGGHRWIMSPTEELKTIQKWILVNLLEKVNLHENVHGFVKEKSIVTNATKHVGKEIILNIDLYRFFDTITERRVSGLFKKMGYTEKLAYDLARLLCVEPSDDYWRALEKENKLKKKIIKKRAAILPQGAPTSPAVSNLLAANLDNSLSAYCVASNLDVTRYADDITISGKRSDLPDLKVIKQIIRQNGFTINIDKIKYSGRHKKQKVTGITVNDVLSVDRKLIKEVQQDLYYCKKYGYKNHLEYKFRKSKIKANYKDWLYGKICFIYSIEKEKAQSLFKQFHLIDWSI